MKVQYLGFAAIVLSTLTAAGVEPPAPFSGDLFATDGNGGNLLSLDVSTGASTIVGFMGFTAPSLAMDPTTGILYAGQGSGAPFLHTVDTTTGEATFVGSTELGFSAIGGLEFNAAGQLYAAVNILGNGGTGSETLARIDKTTGLGTVIGPFGPVDPIEGMEGIAFDANGTLWGCTSARGAAGPPSSLFRIDTATGAATLVAEIADSLGDTPSGGVVSLQFATDGTLFGGTGRAMDTATDGGRLITIDCTTGVFEFVGTESATEDSSLGGLAGANLECTVFLDADTPETGSELQSAPLLTAFGEVSFIGEIRITGDIDLVAAGSTGNVMDIGAPDSSAELSFGFDVESITFIYGGNVGVMSVEARDADGLVVDSFFQASTGDGEPAGPVTLQGERIRSLRWEDPDNSFAPLDNMALVVSKGLVLDFETEDDFATPLVNGQAISTPGEFGRLVDVNGFGPDTYGTAIFDSTPGGPNAGGADPDLLVGLGNMLILQERPTQSVPDIYDVPDDAQLGGTMAFDFKEAVELVSVDLADVCPGPPVQNVTLTLVDQAFNTRNYFVPGGWTSDLLGDGPPGFHTLDLATLTPQPGFQTTATAAEDAGFDGGHVVALFVHCASSAALDNLAFMETNGAGPDLQGFFVLGLAPGRELFTSSAGSWTTQVGEIFASHSIGHETPFSIPLPEDPMGWEHLLGPLGGALSALDAEDQLQPARSGQAHAVVTRKGALPLATLYVQLLIHNARAFPFAPDRSSQGLALTLWSDGTLKGEPFGTADGVHLDLEMFTGADGRTHVRFPYSSARQYLRTR
jgi:hypothetical protein